MKTDKEIREEIKLLFKDESPDLDYPGWAHWINALEWVLELRQTDWSKS